MHAKDRKMNKTDRNSTDAQMKRNKRDALRRLSFFSSCHVIWSWTIIINSSIRLNENRCLTKYWTTTRKRRRRRKPTQKWKWGQRSLTSMQIRSRDTAVFNDYSRHWLVDQKNEQIDRTLEKISIDIERTEFPASFHFTVSNTKTTKRKDSFPTFLPSSFRSLANYSLINEDCTYR